MRLRRARTNLFVRAVAYLISAEHGIMSEVLPIRLRVHRHKGRVFLKTRDEIVLMAHRACASTHIQIEPRDRPGAGIGIDVYCRTSGRAVLSGDMVRLHDPHRGRCKEYTVMELA